MSPQGLDIDGYNLLPCDARPGEQNDAEIARLGSETVSLIAMHKTDDVEITEAVILSNRLRAALKDGNLTQEEFARRVGISFRQANRIVNGKSEPSLLLAKRMAKVLGTTIDYLFKVKVSTRARKSSAA